MAGPSKHVSANDDGSLHESKQSETQSDGSWGRVSSNHYDNGGTYDVHVTVVSSDGEKTIIDIPTVNENMGDVVRGMFGLDE